MSKKPASTPPERPKRRKTDDDVTPTADATALAAAINAPVEDPGGHRRKGIEASAAAGGTPFCPICGTLKTVDVCPVDGHRFGAA